MKVGQVMSTEPVTVRSGANVRTAVRLLARHAITMMPVVDDRGRILGVVAESDVLHDDAASQTVDHVMSRTTVLVHPETEMAEVGRILRLANVKSLPVVDVADQVVGIVSSSDVVRVLARGDDLLRQEILDSLTAAGLRGWRVAVHNGVADLEGPADVPSEAALARRTAEETLGVSAVRVH